MSLEQLSEEEIRIRKMQKIQMRKELENRRYTVLIKESAMDEAKKSKNRAAIIAGIFILGTVASIYFGGQDASVALHPEVANSSLETLGQAFQDINYMQVLLSASAGAFTSRYFKNSKKFKEAQKEFIEANALLESTQNFEEVNDDAKSR